MDYIVRTEKQLALAVKDARKRKNMTQEDVAGLAGSLQKTVSNFESNTSAASISTLYKLLSALDLELVVRDKD